MTWGCIILDYSDKFSIQHDLGLYYANTYQRIKQSFIIAPSLMDKFQNLSEIVPKFIYTYQK